MKKYIAVITTPKQGSITMIAIDVDYSDFRKHIRDIVKLHHKDQAVFSCVQPPALEIWTKRGVLIGSATVTYE